MVDQTEDLNGDRRKERDHGDNAESVRHDVTADGIRCANGEGHQERGGHCARGNAARVERDGGKDLGDDKGKSERDRVSDADKPKDRKTRKCAEHRKTDGDGNANGHTDAEHLFGDRAGCYLFDLFFKDVNGRLRQNDEVAEEHTDGNEEPFICRASERFTDITADREESDGNTCQEENDADVGINDADDELQGLIERESIENGLEYKEENNNGEKSCCNLHELVGDLVEKFNAEFTRIDKFRDGVGGVRTAINAIYKPENENGNDRTCGAQRHQTKAIPRFGGVCGDRRNTDTHRHDKRYGERSCGNAACIKRNGKKVRRDERCEQKGDAIGCEKQISKLDGKNNTKHRKYKEDADTDGNCPNESGRIDRGDRFCENGEVGLGCGYKCADEKTYKDDQPKLFGFGDRCTDVFTHRGHGLINAERKKSQAEDHRKRSEEE